MFNKGWYIVYTKPRHEKKVAEELSRRTIEYYLPTVKTLRQWHDRKKFIEAPIFPSYVFLRANNVKEFYEVAQIEGVIHFVRFGKEVARVTDEVITNIKLVMASEQSVQVTTSYFPPGQKVYIEQGPLTGVSCEVVRSGSNQRILVRVTLLQRSLLVTISATQLTAIQSNAHHTTG